jgi:tungstate transport system substrate-binding protein
MEYLLPHYTKATGNEVKVITGGSGFILQQLERGDVTIAITHQPQLEEQLLVKFPQGRRTPFMYNHFILIGPKDDPAHVATATSFAQALKRIYDNKRLFVSRGDNSGTAIFEENIWDTIGIARALRTKPWYVASGQDMGPTINLARELNAYLITDQGTWFAYANKTNSKLLYEGVSDGKNIYSLIQLKNTQDLPIEAIAFINWIVQADTRKLIDDFKINGQQGFFAMPVSDHGGLSEPSRR